MNQRIYGKSELLPRGVDLLSQIEKSGDEWTIEKVIIDQQTRITEDGDVKTVSVSLRMTRPLATEE